MLTLGARARIYVAAEAVDWTRAQLSDEDRQWLRDLKYVRMVTSFSIVHATLVWEATHRAGSEYRCSPR